MELFLDWLPAQLGEILLVHDDADNLRALDFADYEDRMHRLLRLHYGVVSLVPRAAPHTTTANLRAYFAGDYTALDSISVATGGTVFQRSVWAALRAIPAGQRTSYGALARQIGQPTASRAVGAANGANPIGIVVPCHRVVGAAGTLTGYAGGLARKAWLLAHEGACESVAPGNTEMLFERDDDFPRQDIERLLLRPSQTRRRNSINAP